MNGTLLDEHGIELTDITSHLGRSSGQMLVDRATRPDALFHYYFGRGQRAVTLVENAERSTGILGTRWQTGTRVWFLHTFGFVSSPAQAVGSACSSPEAGLGAASVPPFYAKDANADLGAPAITRTSGPPGVPT